MIKKFLVTEKASSLLEKNHYVLVVDKTATKIELKKYLKDKYEIDNVKINIINTKPKKKRRGRVVGYTQSFKKAIVISKEKIEIFDKLI